MPSLADLSQAVEAYLRGDASLDQFADWYSRASRSMFGESPALTEACVKLGALFSELDYGEMTEDAFRAELANAALAVPSPSTRS